MKKVLIFAKTPIKGVVKTRLKEKNKCLTQDDIYKLYTAFLKDTISAAAKSSAKKIYISYYPESSKNKMFKLLITQGYKKDIASGKMVLIPQQGYDFENRMLLSVNSVRNRHDSLMILGSDTPSITPDIINKSFLFLTKNKEGMVLGPSGEGGIYLIGLKINGEFRFNNLFTRGMEIENFTKKAMRLKLPLLLLNELTDIDIQSDLVTFIGNISALKYSSKFCKNLFIPKHSINVVNKLGLKIERNGNGTDSRNKKLIKK